MLKEITKGEVLIFLQNNFPQYNVTDDPFERYLGYFEDSLIGLITYSLIYERAEINYICVKNEHQGKKVGSRLLETTLGIMEDYGCRDVSLEVNENNEKAINLYKKFLFEEKAKREKYYNGEDALLLARKLGD